MALNLYDIPDCVLEAQYAVRGAIVQKANELEKLGRKIIYCNIGNPQALEQKPLSYARQVIALCEYPDLLNSDLFAQEIKEQVRYILKETKYGLGAYSESKGFEFIRQAVAKFISERDGIKADAHNICITDGASKAVQSVLRLLIKDKSSGIMIPIPQYPLYSATISLYGGTQIPYYLDEKNEWSLSLDLLEESYKNALKNNIKVKAICVINPGNPTGSVLTYNNIAMVIDFAQKYNLSILADEVYQENIYYSDDKFISFAKVLSDKNNETVDLFSFHSCSKGFLGECGHRGGYVEYRNLSKEVEEQLIKLQSISLCSNIVGQVYTYLMVNYPKNNSEITKLYNKEKTLILQELTKRSKILTEGLNAINGIFCNKVQGAMYAFPSIKLPLGMDDFIWCFNLLNNYGVCVVPGSGFGQAEGTHHFRTTILPPTEQIKVVVDSIKDYHSKLSL